MYKKYNRYKDSGVEWLGMVPFDWETKRMKFLFKDVSVKNRPGAELLSVTQTQGVVPRTWVENRMVMPSGNLESFKFIEKGDFAISLRSFEGGLEYCYHDGIISPAYTVLKKTTPLQDEYYKYLFKSKSFISEMQTSIVGIREGKNISYPELSYSLIPIPPLYEQTSIASFLDEKTSQIDHAIELKEKTITLLKEHKQIVIQELVTGKWKIENGEEVIDNGELKIDNARLIKRDEAEMKDSGVEWIGMVPKSWEVKRLKTLGYIYSGLSGKNGNDFSIENIESMKPFIPFTNIYRNLKINTTQYQYVKIGDFEMQNRVIKNDLLFLMSSETLEDIGKSAIYLGKDDELYLNSFCRGFRITNNQAYPEYINYLLNSQSYQDYFSIVARGFTRINLKQEYVNDASILLPDLATQHEIVDFLDKYDININKAITLQEQEIEKLKELKATLIDSAVTGKIKIIEN